MKADTLALLRRTTLPWRVGFVAYAAALTTATHWPSLDVGGDAFQSPDKLTHMLAFAALLVLLWRTRWVPRAWQAGVIVAAWAVADELTQSLPVFDRVFSGQDVAAGLIGVVVTLAWFAALAPVGGPANRARIAWHWFLVDDLFARPAMWLIAGLAGLAGAALLGTVIGLLLSNVGLDSIVSASEVVPSSVLLAAFAGGTAAGVAAVIAGVGRRAAAIGDRRPCFACGRPCRDDAVDARGRGRCAACGAAFHAGQWARPMQMPLGTLKRGLGPAMLAAAGVILVVLAVNLVVLSQADRIDLFRGTLRSWNGLLPDMRLTVDLAVVAIVAAVAVGVYRRRQALLHDRQHVRCRVCNHDLAGTEVTRGEGVCGECGTPFARFTDG